MVSLHVRSSLLGLALAVLSFIIVFTFSQYAQFYLGNYYVPVQRLLFLTVAAFFMIIDQYSLFRNRKMDLTFLIIFWVLSGSLFLIPPASAAGNFINIIILAPFVEEFFFRGFMLGSVFDLALVEKGKTVKIAAVIAAISVSLGGFVIMHTMNEYVFSLIYGFYFCLIFLAFRSLRGSRLSKYAIFFSIIPHFVNNTTVYFIQGPLLAKVLPLSAVFGVLGLWSFLIYKGSAKKLEINE